MRAAKHHLNADANRPNTNKPLASAPPSLTNQRCTAPVRESELNHFTVPVAICASSSSYVLHAEIAQSKGYERRHYMRRASCPT